MREKFKVIILTPSGFLYSGLASVMSECKHGFHLVHRRNPASLVHGSALSCDSVILVAEVSDSPVEKARVRACLWYLEAMMVGGELTKVPVVVLTHDLRVLVAGTVCQLKLPAVGYDLNDLLSRVFVCPGRYLKAPAGWRPLGHRYTPVFLAFLSGSCFRKVAGKLNIKVRRLNILRSELIQLLGVCNRNVLLCINYQDFIPPVIVKMSE